MKWVIALGLLAFVQVTAGYRNLLVNPGANGGTDGWSVSQADAGYEACEPRNNCFVVQRFGGFVQDFKLPDSNVGQFALAVGFARAERTAPEAGITDRPNLHLIFSNQDRTRILYSSNIVSLQTAIHSGSSPDWQKIWAAYEIPAGAAWGNLRMSLGSRKGVEHDGSRGWFDDVGVFVVPTEAEARQIVSNYTRSPK